MGWKMLKVSNLHSKINKINGKSNILKLYLEWLEKDKSQNWWTNERRWISFNTNNYVVQHPFQLCFEFLCHFLLQMNCNFSVFKNIRVFVSFIFLSILSHFFFFLQHLQTVNSTSQPKLFQTIWLVIVWNFISNVHLCFLKKFKP